MIGSGGQFATWAGISLMQEFFVGCWLTPAPGPLQSMAKVQVQYGSATSSVLGLKTHSSDVKTLDGEMLIIVTTRMMQEQSAIMIELTLPQNVTFLLLRRQVKQKPLTFFLVLFIEYFRNLRLLSID